jgi:1-acyl-sn-glycerol-3-phosphate acyltransferase
MIQVPVYRRQDLKENFNEHLNDATFEASYEVLKEGGAIFIFPEGLSYTAPHIQPLRTGIARLALGFFKKTGIMPPIQPVGLNYVHKDKFRSSVLIQYGEEKKKKKKKKKKNHNSHNVDNFHCF